ncbi:MAG: tRNA guanosine(34) transglycosylase Tgt [Nitrospirae bacterium]|nr:MAG: tRNA guanosine(34) transglycosylase Tgt [Nitrospirota bacterium]
MLEFTVQQTDMGGSARVGVLKTAHGTIETPAFMPVGSLGAVKGIGPEDLAGLGFRLILNNAYHLYLRPGHRVIEELGGLHSFTGWPGAILTDSGGFQVFSLAKLCRVTDEGVTFQSHVDGSSHHITPERAIEIQEALGADIIMAFDECVALPSSRERVHEALQRTGAWARRCQAARRRSDQALFGIVQGGHDPALRVESAQDLVSLGFDGYAVGGLSVGEEKSVMYSMLDATVPELPAGRPRYLMGVGLPEDLVEGVARGIDLFDCVVPTRHGRTGWLFTADGRVLIKQARYAKDERPIDPACCCPVCRKHSRAYLHHLFGVKEMLGVRLNTLHNLYYFADLMRQIRSAIAAGSFAAFRREFHAKREAAGVVGADDAADRGGIEELAAVQEGKR